MVQNTGDASVFFDDVAASSTSDDLISAQVDPSQPQVQGLSSVTSPLVTDRHMSVRLAGFDPEQFDLSPTSHLVKLTNALVAGSGAGGLRKQQIIARTGNALSGTNFIELDGFWGALFSLTRAAEETLPLNDDGNPINPVTDVADSVTWDTAESRDGRYRSRIEQLANGYAYGATYDGVRKAAQAVLNCDVEVVEGWTYANSATSGSIDYSTNTWLAVSLQNGTWGSLDGTSWANLETGETVVAATPIGNRGEVIVIPGRVITDAEQLQLHQVMDNLLPAGTMLTISSTPFTAEVEVPVLSVNADSTYWQVVSLVEQQASINSGAIDLYSDSTDVESARPAMSSYSGERWSFNSRVADVSSYAINSSGVTLPQIDYQTVTFSDGTSHAYLPTEALVDSNQLGLARAGAEGVLTSFPYVAGRMGT